MNKNCYSCIYLKFDDPEDKLSFSRSCHCHNNVSNAGDNCEETGGCHIKFPEANICEHHIELRTHFKVKFYSALEEKSNE